MFMDESGDHSLEKIDSSYPIFILAGCIFDFDYYNEKVEPTVSALKKRYFGRADIILRSYDIRKQKNDFASLVDKKKRDQFYDDINKMMVSFEFTIIAAAVNKSHFKSQYVDPTNPYHLCFHFVLERAVMFLGRSKEKMMFRIESRETHNDRILAKEYEEFKKGDSMFSADEIQSKLVDLSFNQKSQNIAGMQIADLVAYPIGKWVMDNTRENPAFEIVKKKLHQKEGRFLGFGLKVFP